MKELPYFRWYAKDAETDERYSSMTDAELGFYHRCLNKAWINSGLPADPGARARLLGRTKAYADRAWKTVGMCFEPSTEDPQRLVNRRQEEERSHAISKSVSSTRAVRSRYGRSSNEPPRAYASESDSEEVKKTSTAREPDDGPDRVNTVAKWIQQFGGEMGVSLNPDAGACMRITSTMLRHGKDLDDLQEIFRDLYEARSKPKNIGWLINVLEAKLGGGVNYAAQ